MNAWRFFFRPSMIRFMLILAFFFNLVGTDGLKNMVASLKADGNHANMPIQERLMHQHEFNTLIEELVKQAEAKYSRGQVYSPTDYFGDIQKIDAIKHAADNGVPLNEGLIFRLRELAMKSLKHGYTEEDMYRASNEYKDFRSGAAEGREKTKSKLREMGFLGVLLWLIIFYLKNLPLALILYLVWIREENGGFKFPRPLRFLLALVLYPIIISRTVWCWLRKEGRELYAEAELRRTKKQLFTYLSDEELTRVKGFANSSLSFSHWKMQLAKSGLKPRHGLALALVVTFVFLMMPRPKEVEAKKVGPGCIQSVVLEQIAKSSLPRMSIDKYKSQIDGQDFSSDRDIAANWAVLLFHQIVLFAVILVVIFRKFLLPTETFQIPRQAVRFELVIVSAQ